MSESVLQLLWVPTISRAAVNQFQGSGAASSKGGNLAADWPPYLKDQELKCSDMRSQKLNLKAYSLRLRSLTRATLLLCWNAVGALVAVLWRVWAKIGIAKADLGMFKTMQGSSQMGQCLQSSSQNVRRVADHGRRKCGRVIAARQCHGSPAQGPEGRPFATSELHSIFDAYWWAIFSLLWSSLAMPVL